MNDLFSAISPETYNVKLETFEGPLDLLLHLIKQNEVDIYNIPMAEITRQYLAYIELMKELNLDLAGDFLLMASTLVQIKSKMLLPLPALDENGEEEESDPRAELVRRLLEYQRYKDAGQDLDRRQLLGRDVFVREVPLADETAPVTLDTPPLELELFDLVAAFQQVLARIPIETLHEVGADNFSISDRVHEILSLLQGREAVCFDELFPETFSREYVVATFLAMLELCKLRLIRLTQAASFGSIWLTAAVSEAQDLQPVVEVTYGH
jgi:segregation and condensation protein A